MTILEFIVLVILVTALLLIPIYGATRAVYSLYRRWREGRGQSLKDKVAVLQKFQGQDRAHLVQRIMELERAISMKADRITDDAQFIKDSELSNQMVRVARAEAKKTIEAFASGVLKETLDKNEELLIDNVRLQQALAATKHVKRRKS
jgi:hypothetical protein